MSPTFVGYCTCYRVHTLHSKICLACHFEFIPFISSLALYVIDEGLFTAWLCRILRAVNFWSHIHATVSVPSLPVKEVTIHEPVLARSFSPEVKTNTGSP